MSAELKHNLDILSEFTSIVGPDSVTADPVEIDYFSQDYFSKGLDTLAVVAPKNTDELARTIKTATSKGLAIFPRGGGYSYTDGYAPTQPGITLDLRGMDKIIEINDHDMYVTVEPGCTWATLNDALAPHKLQTPFWGPFSGLRATVGGSISQGTLSWGSGKYGVSSETVVDLEVITADGTIIKTGASGQPGHSPFFRNYGPDLTGIFCSDCGALGVKSAITLRLIKKPSHSLGLSFSFPSFEVATQAAAAVAREGVVVNNLGMPAQRAIDAAGKTSLVEDLKSLWKIGKTGAGFIDGAVRMAKVAIAGRRFLNNIEFTFHYLVESANRKSIEGQAQAVREAVGDLGVEIANTVPTMLRADPFLEYDMLSPTGQRQLPPSTILPFSAVVPFHQKFMVAIEKYRPQMQNSGMSVTPVFGTVGTNGFLYEPVIAWDDAVDEFHRRHTADAMLETVADRKADPAARELAAEIRQLMIDMAFEHGGIHLQIGKVYPYLRERDANAIGMLKDIKRRVDPNGLINPGALGL